MGLKNKDLQKVLDYPNPNVIGMMKNGTMRLPAGKATIAAEFLQIDPVFLLGKVITEADPGLWDGLQGVQGEVRMREVNNLSDGQPPAGRTTSLSQ